MTLRMDTHCSKFRKRSGMYVCICGWVWVYIHTYCDVCYIHMNMNLEAQQSTTCLIIYKYIIYIIRFDLYGDDYKCIYNVDDKVIVYMHIVYMHIYILCLSIIATHIYFYVAGIHIANSNHPSSHSYYPSTYTVMHCSLSLQHLASTSSSLVCFFCKPRIVQPSVCLSP